MRDTYTNSIIKVHYIWFYNVYKLYILIVESFIHTKTKVAHHFEKVSMFRTKFTGQDKIHRTKFTYTIASTKYGNEEHGNL